VTDRDALEERLRADCAGGRWAEAATAAIEGYGPEVFSYLVAVTRSESDASEVYSQFCENLWSALPRFRWESTFRTWAYVLARHAWSRHARDPNRRSGRREPLSNPAVEAVAEQVRSRTMTYLRTEVKDRLTALRDELSPEDRTLLILRIDRKLAWRDIAQVMADESAVSLDEAGLKRQSAALRKRFERVKAELRAKLRP
jgi:RNA polymerase sigma-70 factor (ECF subfamily)